MIWPYWIQRCESNIKSIFEKDSNGYVMSFGVMSLPGLVINDKVVSYGKIISKAYILKFIES